MSSEPKSMIVWRAENSNKLIVTSALKRNRNFLVLKCVEWHMIMISQFFFSFEKKLLILIAKLTFFSLIIMKLSNQS